MTTETHVMVILERANPVPPGELVDVPVGVTRYLETVLQQRSEPMTVIDPTPTRIPGQPPRRRWTLVAVAASVLAIVVASIALIVATRDDNTTIVDQPDPTVAPTTAPVPTTAAATDPEAAQAVVAQFFDAYNAGDTDAVLAKLSADAIITETFAHGAAEIDPATGREERSQWEQLTAWRNGGWRLLNVACEPLDEQPADGTSFACSFETATTLVAAAAGQPTETIAQITVVDGAITELRVGFGQPTFNVAADAFADWMNAWYPDATGWALEDWSTFEEAAENGATRAAFAQEWAGWLEDHNCGLNRPCTMSIEDWVVDYDSQCVGSDPNEVSDELLAHMRRLPGTSESFLAVERLLATDAGLVRGGLSAERTGELQQQRLDLMIELGIDERCRPVIG